MTITTTSHTEPATVLPCPICGGGPKLVRASVGDWWLECEQRSHYLCSSQHGRDQLQAINNWNRMVGKAVKP